MSQLREVFRTYFLQVTGFPRPEHHLCSQPSSAHFGAGTALPGRGRAPPGPLLGTHSPENPPCPAPSSADGWERKTLFFKAHSVSTDLFPHRYWHDATKPTRLREQVWAVLSDLASRPTPGLFFQPCFRLLLRLMPSQPRSWSREPTGHRGLCRRSCCTKPDVRHPILLHGAGFHAPGQGSRESQTFLSFFCQLL